jgi:ABC-type bacteriocin/lantibiotic exporter with double-glycine peptidase domain
MSKFEILQNNKLGEEMKKQSVLMKERIKIEQRGGTKKLLRQSGSSAIIDGMQITIYIVVGMGIITGNYTFAYMILLLQLINTVSRYIWNIRKYLKEYYKSIVHVEKLRDTFDTIPTMEDDSDKKQFIYKKGDFSVKNISFAYHKIPIFKNFSLDITG